MDDYQVFVLRTFLAQWPKQTGFYEVLGMIENNDPDVMLYEPFEKLPRGEVTERMELTVDSLKRSFVARQTA